MNEQNFQDERMSKKEKKELKRLEKQKEQEEFVKRKKNKFIFKISFIAFFSVLGIGFIIWYFVTRPPIPEGEITSRSGIHWHSELSIVIKGEKQEIPADVGIGAVHQPIHTHDKSGVIHLEIDGLVKKEDTSLQQFFKNWGKQFNSNCIFDSCNNGENKVKFFVNGKENNEFESYKMRDGDKMEIRYE